jgi:hypothetical protein
MAPGRRRSDSIEGYPAESPFMICLIQTFTKDRPAGLCQSLSMAAWQALPNTFLEWWQNRHSRGMRPVLCSSQSPSERKQQPRDAKCCSAKFLSQPLKAGDSTPKVRSGDISSIMRPPYPAPMALAASSTVHQPGRMQ